MKHEKQIKSMSLDEKIAFCSGLNYWQTKPIKNIPSIFMCDGPHGLRKQENGSDNLGINASVQATCFPTASAAAATWDVGLMREMGEALGDEALSFDASIILGPGVNMKRNPLCGRNFEYYSEDPFLSGKLAAAWISGVQSKKVGVSLKHFAVNNQETKRMTADMLVDERALREYYLPSFEIAVKEAHPTTLMCAYNKLNGTYCSDNKTLLTDILRTEWGFDGVVMSDWGATNNRVAGFEAGLDLEMPGSEGRFDKEVKTEVTNGRLDEALINLSAERLISLIEQTKQYKKQSTPNDFFEQHHNLARRIAAAGGILLKNKKEILPLQKGEKITVIGALAKEPRYQGSGSSLVSPPKISSLLDGLSEYTSIIDYHQGYQLNDVPDKELKQIATEAAKNSQKVLLCVGLTEVMESEGFDRQSMSISKNQLELIDAIRAVNTNIIVVLVGGAAIEMPWEPDMAAILHMQLTGQAGGLAAADLLFGHENPSGKLTETYPNQYSDVVSSDYYFETPKQSEYRESMYCGYRYFDSANKPVRFPFGFGLSYTTFNYSNLETEIHNEHNITVRFTVKNTGTRDGAEASQLYVAPKTGGVYRPKHELKGFAKTFLKSGEEKTVLIHLDKRSFAYYEPDKKDWIVEAGQYNIEIGSSSQNILLDQSITLTGSEPKISNCSSWYYKPDKAPTQKDFKSIYGDFPHLIPKSKGSYDLNSSILEMKETSWFCKIMYKIMEKILAKSNGGKVDYNNINFKMVMVTASDNPIKSMPLFAPNMMSVPFVQFIVDSANGNTLSGLIKFIKAPKQR